MIFFFFIQLILEIITSKDSEEEEECFLSGEGLSYKYDPFIRLPVQEEDENDKEKGEEEGAEEQKKEDMEGIEKEVANV